MPCCISSNYKKGREIALNKPITNYLNLSKNE
nr:MAG TPA: hypothetical protein [Caudoviricetes sp.]